jgi:NAD+-dependent farnesol dehydrogenase
VRDTAEGTPALVTGASGFIGRHLVRRLLSRNRCVIALAGSERSLEDLASPLLEIRAGRIEDEACCRELLTPGLAVFHLAAVRNQPKRSLDAFNRINVQASCALARACAEAGASVFVNVSTALVFGPGETPRREEDASGEGPADGGYVWSKRECARRVQEIGAAGLRVVTVYPGIVFGPDEKTHPNRVTSHIRSLLRTRVDWAIGGGGQRRNLVFVQDVVDGILLAESAGRDGRGYILGGENWSPRELNRAALAAAGASARARLSVPVALARFAARAADRMRRFPRAAGYERAVDTLSRPWCFSSERAGKELGYCCTPLREAVARTVQFLKAGADDRG